VKRVRLLLALVVAFTGSVACGTRIDAKKDSVAAIRRTEGEPRGIAYEKVAADGTITRVDLLVSDDYRYKAQVSVDGQPALDVVVRDDALAVRVLDVDAAADAVGEAVAAATSGGGAVVATVPELSEESGTEADPDSTATPSTAVAAPTPEVIQALETRNWVTDPTGAPELFSATAGKVLEEGEGGIIAPVLEALRSLQATENALQQAASVNRFNEENPNYDPRVDTFPKPASGSDVLRFDLFPPALPSPNQSLGSAQDSLPDNQHFRRMAVYIDNGRVSHVLETIEINPRLLDDIEGRYDIDLPLEDEPRAARMAVDELNAQRVAAGLDPIDAGTVTLEVLDIDGTEAILLPTEGATGNLKGLVQVKSADRSSAVPLAQP